jgi:molybdopterin converting factor small subunit
MLSGQAKEPATFNEISTRQSKILNRRNQRKKMVEIRYGEQYEITDIAGQTVSEAREQFKGEFGIPDKAKAKLNGSKVKQNAELDTVLNDDDKVSFAVARSRTPFLIGALLLALAATGGVFTFGFLNANTTMTAITHEDFAQVTANASISSFNVYGLYKGKIFAGQDLFYIQPSSDWNGDLVTTVSLGNVGDLAKWYRAFALQLEMVYTNGPNAGQVIPLGLSQNQTVLLTLDYPTVNMFTVGTANMTVRVKTGYYVAQHFWPTDGDPSPQIFCDITQGNNTP